MIENEQYEIEGSQAARKIAQRARDMAEAQHVTLTGTKWHRGHEAADLDDWWLTLMSDTGAITERFPSEWLEAFGTDGNDPRVAQRLYSMVQVLAAPPKPAVTQPPKR